MAYVKPAPVIRDMMTTNIQYTIEKIFKVKEATYPYKNCLNCIRWSSSLDKCIRFNAKPPTEIIVYSCEHHEDNDDIPF